MNSAGLWTSPCTKSGEESGQLEFCHNPFSMPQGGMQALEEKDPPGDLCLSV